MSSERIILAADLTYINNALSSLKSDIGTVSGQVEAASQGIQVTRDELAQLAADFHEFVRRDELSKALALAETRLIKVRQELDTKFGHYAEVRRRTTGILQAVDVQVVRQETMHAGTEDLMVSAPRYWLAPGLVALTAWLTDRRELAEKAVAEALRRDPNKTSLMFALISRRGGRHEATARWLEQFLSLQNPADLDREVVMVIEAVAHGVFGHTARVLCSRAMDSWLETLSNEPGFVDEQRDHWRKALMQFFPDLGADEFPHLRKVSTNWSGRDLSLLEYSLRGARSHQVILDHFKRIFETAPSIPARLTTAVDDILDKLVAHFDDEELPLRRDERKLQLIVDHDGDKAEAELQFDLESKALDEKMSFTQLLTNAAAHAEVAQASSATQRLATALSREWIESAHEQLTAEIRLREPATAKLEIAGWTGETKDGSEETALSDRLSEHIDAQKVQALSAIKTKWWMLAVAPLCLLLGSLGLAAAVVLLVMFAVNFFGAKSKRAKVAADYAKLKAENLTVLRAALAEMVDYRREWHKADMAAEQIAPLLRSFDPREMTAPEFSHARQVIGNN